VLFRATALMNVGLCFNGGFSSLAAEPGSLNKHSASHIWLQYNPPLPGLCSLSLSAMAVVNAEGYAGQIDEAVSFIRRSFKDNNTLYRQPKFGVICGSGLGGLAGRLRDVVSIRYAEIPHFPVSTVSGHHSLLAFGLLKGVPTVCMIGRLHYYEGYELDQVTFPVRVLARLGITTLLVTNDAGGIDPSMDVGDVMAIIDHVSFLQLSGQSPLRGPNADVFGPRFPPLTRVYYGKTFELMKLAAERAAREKAAGKGAPVLSSSATSYIKKGIYCGVGGPSYETAAEVRLLRMIGGSAVGMSTVPEVTVAAHCGIERILAFSLITNRCVSDLEALDQPPPTHAEVLEASSKRIEDLELLVSHLCGLLFGSELGEEGSE
jgi:purine-nucleoside phosphorylase